MCTIISLVKYHWWIQKYSDHPRYQNLGTVTTTGGSNMLSQELCGATFFFYHQWWLSHLFQFMEVPGLKWPKLLRMMWNFIVKYSCPTLRDNAHWACSEWTKAGLYFTMGVHHFALPVTKIWIELNLFVPRIKVLGVSFHAEMFLFVFFQ